jgi:hypothetical protein
MDADGGMSKYSSPRDLKFINGKVSVHPCTILFKEI